MGEGTASIWDRAFSCRRPSSVKDQAKQCNCISRFCSDMTNKSTPISVAKACHVTSPYLWARDINSPYPGYLSLCVHSLADGLVGCFKFLPIT